MDETILKNMEIVEIGRHFDYTDEQLKKIKEYLDMYVRREINKTQLKHLFGNPDYKYFYMFIRNRGIEIWDKKVFTEDNKREAISLYQQKKFTVKELSEKFQVTEVHLRALFRKNGLYIWDYKRKYYSDLMNRKEEEQQLQEKNDNESSDEKLFNWRKEWNSSNPYSRIFYKE
ncbi:MAG: hypothetical protein QXG00_04145 [Candidatus Woesearchaeota archaeon]